MPEDGGVRLRDLVVVSSDDAGTIDHVVDGVGPSVPAEAGGSDVAHPAWCPVG